MSISSISLRAKFLLSICLIIVPTIGAIFLWVALENRKNSLEQVLNQARILTRQVIITRQWISDCGGILVKKNSLGAKGTFYAFEGSVNTEDGLYVKFTPSMVTKKLSQYSSREQLYRFRLAGLSPINPENKPDLFESSALQLFTGSNINEIYRIEKEKGTRYLRYLVPLTAKASCLKCHKEQGYSKGSQVGGLSVFLPLSKMDIALHESNRQLILLGGALICLVIFTLFVLIRKLVLNPMTRLQIMTSKIAQGNLNYRVKIKTGDEFQVLAESYNFMAENLQKERELLEEKIKNATKELAQANEELKALDRMKSDFLSNMSHELRSPLTVIRGGVDYLKRIDMSEDAREYLSLIDRHLDRLIRLVSDAFDFSKIEAGRMQWCFANENISELIEEVIELIEPLAQKYGIELIYTGKEDVFAEIDLERIEQVLVNLIENSIQYSMPNTKVIINVEDLESRVRISVSDEGMGIPSEKQDVIFKKFYTIPSSKNKKVGGTGLGLAISKGIIEAHGGKIWVESTYGEGSTFYFEIPKVQHHKIISSEDC